MAKKIKTHLIVFLLFFIAVLYITYPLIFHLNKFVTGTGDELLIAWIHAWVQHSFLTDIGSLFQANIFYPYPNTLAYSDSFIVTSLLTLIPVLVLGEPIVAVNVTLIFSLVLLGFSIYLLSYFLTRDFFASLLSGILVIFSPAILDKYVHIQVLAVCGVPLAILFFFQFLKTAKTRFLIYGLICFLLQTYNSFLPGNFILVAWIVSYGCFRFLTIRSRHSRGRGNLGDTNKLHLLDSPVQGNDKNILTKKHLALLVGAFLMLLPIVLPYYSVSHEFHYVRDIRDTIHFALQPEDLLYPNDFTRLKPILMQQVRGEMKPGYLGFVFTILVIVAIFFVVTLSLRQTRFARNDNHLHIISLFIIAMLGLLLSLGPFLHINRHTIHHPFPIPLPYLFFYYLMPGFKGFRNSARWEVLFIICISPVIAVMLQSLLRKYSKKVKYILYGVLFVCIVGEYKYPMHFFAIPQKKDFPAVYHWLATTPKDTKIIELPIYNWNMTNSSKEFVRLYYSTVHFRRMVNGFSGFSPPVWEKRALEFSDDFPNDKTVSYLKSIKITYVILHKTEFMNWEKVMKNLKQYPEIKLVKRFENDFVYRISY